VYNVDRLEKGTIHIPGQTEKDGRRLPQASQNGAQFKTSELLILRIFHLILSDLR
jgi:hypothetical protein